MDPQGKYWCYTMHAPYGAHPSIEEDYKTQRSNISVTYSIGQEEKCPDTGALHLQCYVEFNCEVRFSWLKKTFDPRIHWERRKGSAALASAYCEKEESYNAGGVRWKVGEISNPAPGKRNDLHDVADKVMSGMSLKRLAEENPVEVIKFARGIQTLIDLVQPPPADTPKRVIILYGAPGTGKSSWARRFLEDLGDTFYTPAMNNAGVCSFESYADQQWIWLDDFASGALTAQALKCMCDRYPTQLAGRGSSRWARHHGVIITSNYPIETWFKEQVEATAIRRRCEQIWIYEKEKWRYDGGKMHMPAEKPNPMKEFVK